MIDLGAILNSPYMGKGNLKGEYEFGLSGTLDQTVLIKELQEKLDAGEPGKIQVHVKKYGPDVWNDVWIRTYETISGRGAGRYVSDSMYRKRRAEFWSFHPGRTDDPPGWRL